ncbi:MAG: DUF2924 domain-containing protein [Rhodospirillaceae bacterium]|nr:DUF2924 domain-containing protein [Rhodospirillaceae bacterium]
MVNELLSRIERADLAELRALWIRELGEPLPACGNRLYLRLTLAWRVQVAADVRKSKRVTQRLDRLAEKQAVHSNLRGLPAPAMPRGTELIREWQGTKHRVLIVSDGFIYQGDRYASLSVIARKITGTRWSGPRFFGLKGGTGR